MVFTPEDEIDDEWKHIDPAFRRFSLYVDEIPYGKNWSSEEIDMLRPIAETLCLLDGDPIDRFEIHLQEAFSLFNQSNGEALKMKHMVETNHENDSVREAWENWKTIKKLS